MDTSETIYRERISDFEERILRLRKPLTLMPWIRLACFVMAGFAIYYLVKTPGVISAVSLAVTIAGFLAAGFYDTILKRQIRQYENLIAINHKELKAIAGDWSGFDPGHRFMDQNHPYTHDLDIFGNGSLYQHLNRSATVFGSERLARYFSDSFHFKDEITDRQKAITEISHHIEFRQRFQLIFVEDNTSAEDLKGVESWLSQTTNGKGQRLLAIVSWLLPVVTIITIMMSAAGIIPYQLPVTLVLLQFAIVFSYGRKTMSVHQQVTTQAGILKKYSTALILIDSVDFKSEYCKKLKMSLVSNDQVPPGVLISRLSGILSMMDSNLNFLVSGLMNGLFMFNLHVVRAAETWRTRYRSLVPVWFSIMAEFDALSSFGTFAFNHPAFTYPEPVYDDFQIDARQMGHPLILKEECVTNDLIMAGWKQLRIITGANMSGKSTFLRAVGCNLVLAMAGAPVFASRFLFYPIEIHSSIRTNDSLSKRESYFYAELKRLKSIIDELESGKQLLILLDEILKGTNSSDKQTGSVALIRQLMKYNMAGLFATHDLALGELVKHFPAHIQNLCFEIQITGNRMEIDYKLQPGVCRNLNASFLMRRMGIIVGDEVTG